MLQRVGSERLKAQLPMVEWAGPSGGHGAGPLNGGSTRVGMERWCYGVWSLQMNLLTCCPRLQPGNQMNSSLLSLYRKGNPESVPSTPRGASTPGQPVPVAASKPARTPGNTRVSEGGWFIDSTPGRERPHPILVDLCAEEKGPAQSEEVSRLEKRRVNKGKRRNKGAKQDVDKEIQSLLILAFDVTPYHVFEISRSSSHDIL
uniref:Uncharacterized protein n=1 Tax=Callorhinchus milii TaxID=7868 RepID=A0A4W3JQV3_CALMI